MGNDPRAAGVRSLRQYMPLPQDEAEAKIERQMLRRMDLLGPWAGSCSPA